VTRIKRPTNRVARGTDRHGNNQELVKYWRDRALGYYRLCEEAHNTYLWSYHELKSVSRLARDQILEHRGYFSHHEYRRIKEEWRNYFRTLNTTPRWVKALRQLNRKKGVRQHT